MRVLNCQDTLHEVLEYYRERYVSEDLQNFLFTGGIPYGTTWTEDFKLDRLDGKFTKAYLHISIERRTDPPFRGKYAAWSYVL
jgi:hypothetical protein